MKLQQLFSIYKQTASSERWRHWFMKWKIEQLQQTWQLHERYGCNIIPLSEKSKKPLAGVKFDRVYSYEEMVYWLGRGCNVGILANQRIYFLDIDMRSSILSSDFWHIESARGLIYPFINDADIPADALNVLQADTLRSENMYVAAPPSITCLYDSKGHENCRHHEWIIRTWAGNPSKIYRASDFAKIAFFFSYNLKLALGENNGQ